MVGAMFLAGAGVYVQTYDVQAILPGIGTSFGVSATQSVLLLSSTTVGMAIGVLPWAYVSDRFGRLNIIRSCLLLATLISLVSPFISGFVAMLIARFIKGVFLGGVTGLAVTYLFEELPVKRAVIASGIYISGNTVGGVATRVLSGTLAHAFGWRASLELIAVLGLLIACVFMFVTRDLSTDRPGLRGRSDHGMLKSFWRSGVLRSFVQGFVTLGVFNALFSVIPFKLSDSYPTLGAVLTSVVLGLYVVAFLPAQIGGRLAARFGTGRVLALGYLLAFGGLLLINVPTLSLLIAGVSALVFGTFLIHPLSSAESGRRMPNHRAQSTALYQISWLTGATLVSPLASTVYVSADWTWSIGLLTAILAIGAVGAFADRRGSTR